MSEFDDIMGSPREPSEAGRVGKGEKALTDGEAPLAGIRYPQGFFDALPGEEREQRWLQERLATLSVREGVALTAAIQRHPPESAVDAIKRLQSLDYYEVRINAGSYEALGHSYLRNETEMPQSALLFVDLEQTGRYYEDHHPGLFVGDCYVEYPQKNI